MSLAPMALKKSAPSPPPKRAAALPTEASLDLPCWLPRFDMIEPDPRGVEVGIAILSDGQRLGNPNLATSKLSLSKYLETRHRDEEVSNLARKITP